jgi:site-specific DNA recombinase
MRAVIYARYSTELQREASIEDQVRLCSARIEAEGWSLGTTYSDYAQSGATQLRPGYQQLLADARSGAFDVVIAEALDRLSRDQEHIAALYKQLAFAGVTLVTLSEGEINELHVGLKGTMNALFLKDLRLKVRRGLEGRVRNGRSGGGIAYGYEVTREYDSHGEPVRGGRKINLHEAQIVVRIFKEFAAGRSPRAIAKQLNSEGVTGPFGGTWGPSTIYGNWRRGTGILNNVLYRGQLVWNRQRFIKDPTSGRRLGRQNPTGEWVVQELPDLRIVDDELWTRAKERQEHVRTEIRRLPGVNRPERARRPASLFSSLIVCGECGGGFSKRSEHHFGCSNARNRGTCSNRLTIRRDVLETSVLAGLKCSLMDPDLAREFCAEYHRELNRLSAARQADHDLRRGELNKIDRQIRCVIEAIKDGLRTPGMTDELQRLEARKYELSKMLHGHPTVAPRLHPALSDLYRQKIARLGAELSRDALRDEATSLIRSLIKQIRLVRENDRLEIELVGEMPAILAFANDSPRSTMPTGMQITMVAGEGLEPPTLGL